MFYVTLVTNMHEDTFTDTYMMHSPYMLLISMAFTIIDGIHHLGIEWGPLALPKHVGSKANHDDSSILN